MEPLRSTLRNAFWGKPRWRAVCVALGLVLSPWQAAAQDFGEGRSAYNLGEYGRAFAIWQRLALRGDPKAQSSIAYLHLRGLGVPVDHGLALAWYSEAALKGRPEALYFLGTLYLNGQGIPRDNVRAYVACELALAQGIAAGLACRDSAAEDMTESQKRDADKAVIRWYRNDDEAQRQIAAPPSEATAMNKPP